MLTARYDQLGLERGDKILDLGCGFGRHAFEAARRGADVIALDAGRDEVEGVKNMFAAMVAAGELDAATLHSAAVQGDALHLPFPDATFDRVICSEVLEHIPDDLGAMGELARVLKPGGTMAITVPALRTGTHQLGALRRVPQRAGRSHPHLPETYLERASALGRSDRHRSPLRPRPAQSVLVVEVSRRHDERRRTGS